MDPEQISSSATSPAPEAPETLRWLRYLAPVLLAVLVILLDQISALVPFWSDFSAVTMLSVAVAPLTELYYLWQRPRHLRYPLLLSVCLLGFHGALGLTYWLHAREIASLTIGGAVRFDALAALLLSSSALMVLMVYWLRSLYKHPKRWIDWVKLALANLFFATFVLDYLLRHWLPQLLPPHAPVRIWIGLSLIVSAGLFLLFHLIDEMAMPPLEGPDPYESLIEEIQPDKNPAPRDG